MLGQPSQTNLLNCLHESNNLLYVCIQHNEQDVTHCEMFLTRNTFWGIFTHRRGVCVSGKNVQSLCGKGQVPHVGSFWRRVANIPMLAALNEIYFLTGCPRNQAISFEYMYECMVYNLRKVWS